MKITDDMLSAQAAEARELWLQSCTPDALPEHRFSRKFRREMRRLVRAQKHSAAFNQSLRLARRTAAVLLLSAAVSFGCAMSVEAYRVSLINTVVRVFNDLTDYRFHRPCRPKPTARRSHRRFCPVCRIPCTKPMSAAHLTAIPSPTRALPIFST
ncbi:MAG: hypothetical protein ACLSGI_08000 [Butyricicoccaceae bacterium]